ncbi:seminal metalloprotease 1-like [Haematobia irritans]|uniref:seminal metalloprotease 1-like n=1 Tax=Haematobia irritans TaxID=7368 RepID=UPI003F4F55AB
MNIRYDFIPLIGILSLVFVNTWSAPLDYPDIEDADTELDGGYLLDDMIVDVVKNGAVKRSFRWPRATVYYKISSKYNETFINSIKLAMSTLESVSCIRFREATKKIKIYLTISPIMVGCHSRVGYSGKVQRLNLDMNLPKCSNPVVIMHELLHTLGFYHEHMSPDRDDYIVVNWENIIPGKEHVFHKLSNDTITDFGVGYDYESIMHYGRKGFTVNGMETITPLDTSANIGQREHLSEKDIAKLNIMYNCTMKPVTEMPDGNYENVNPNPIDAGNEINDL